MFSTEEYVKRVEAAEGHGKGDEGFLELSPEQLASRSVTDRPVVGPHVVPQRQLTQIPDEEVMEVSVIPCHTVWMNEMGPCAKIKVEIPRGLFRVWVSQSSSCQSGAVESGKTFGCPFLGGSFACDGSRADDAG